MGFLGWPACRHSVISFRLPTTRRGSDSNLNEPSALDHREAAAPLAKISKIVYCLYLRAKELIRWLSKEGATFKEGTKGSHLKVYFQGLQTVIPVHHGKDLKAGTLHAILRDLGLRKEDIK